MVSEAEITALIIDCDISQRKYRKSRKLANKSGKCWPTYENCQKYRNENCMPKSDEIKTPSDDCIFVDLEPLLHHQIFRILTPILIERMQFLKLIKNARFVLMWKYGADGLSGFLRRKQNWHPPLAWKPSSLYASTAALLGLKALFPDGTSEILWENVNVNSPAGSIPIR